MKALRIAVIRLNNISALMIADKEEKTIGASLKALDFTKEIILILNEKQEDRTEQIAMDYGATIYKIKWLGYASTKNFGLQKCNYEWVLNIDADEVVTKPLSIEISRLPPNKREGYWICRRNFYKDKWLKHGGYFPDYQLRLFKKDICSFAGTYGELHEGVSVSNPGFLQHYIDHYCWEGYQDLYAKVREYSITEGLNMAKPTIRDYEKIPWIFFAKYFLKYGFLDGWAGFNSALYSSFYQLRKLVIYHSSR